MRLLRVGDRGHERPMIWSAPGRGFDLAPITADIDSAFLASEGLERARDALEAGILPEVDITGLRVGAPLARPGVVLCIGMNYGAHARESGAEPPQTPVMFYKPPNTVVGPHDDILLPPGAQHVDWEVELGVVIGRSCRYLASPEQAMSHIAGFVLADDVSERDFQLAQSGGQWSKGKASETFTPLGPWLVTPDEVAPENLRLTSAVNGERRQDGTTADLIFGIGYLLWHLSQYTVLDPGDVICTGTPEGVALSGRFPYLQDGDVVEVAIEGLGAQRSRCVRATV